MEINKIERTKQIQTKRFIDEYRSRINFCFDLRKFEDEGGDNDIFCQMKRKKQTQ